MRRDVSMSIVKDIALDHLDERKPRPIQPGRRLSIDHS
jgi:hypothetical protein